MTVHDTRWFMFASPMHGDMLMFSALRASNCDELLPRRKVDLQQHEVLVSVFVPFTRKHEYVKEFKQAHRRDDDIAIVNAGMRVRMQQTTGGRPFWGTHLVCSMPGAVLPLETAPGCNHEGSSVVISVHVSNAATHRHPQASASTTVSC